MAETTQQKGDRMMKEEAAALKKRQAKRGGRSTDMPHGASRATMRTTSSLTHKTIKQKKNKLEEYIEVQNKQ